MSQIQIIFAQDEYQQRNPDPTWTREELFAQDGIFFLKDVIKILNIDANRIIKRARTLQTEGKPPWQVMGVRKMWNHYMVRMKIFTPYFEAHFKEKWQTVDSSLDGNTLLKQKGIFPLSEVCRHIPFSLYQINYQRKKMCDSRTECGVWKDEETNRLLVDMEIFAPWIKALWRGEFKNCGQVKQ